MIHEIPEARVNGVLTDAERRFVGAAHQFGLILSGDWPDVAAHLLAQGAEGQAVSALAGLPRRVSPWSVDPLVPQLLAELAVPDLAVDEAGDLIARLLWQAADARSVVDEFAAIRRLARLSPDLDYPDGVIGDAYYASEWLDCECHTSSPERDAAVALENTLRRSDPLAIDPTLLQAVSASWF